MVAGALFNQQPPLAMLPWSHLKAWQPFRLDALGLVTLLGADEVNNAVGRLVKSRWLEYMPCWGLS